MQYQVQKLILVGLFMCMLFNVHGTGVNYINKLPVSADADWVIVGAGPAGISTVGVLLDIGVPKERIVWIDQQFDVGRVGQFYGTVPSNNKTKEFIDFINACQVFQECKHPVVQALRDADPSQYNTLSVIVEPLRCITQHLFLYVHHIKDTMTGLFFNDGMWHVATQSNGTVTATHVVLATGAHPRILEYENHKVIPLDYALNQSNLRAIVASEDRVGVVGSAHSAILLLKYLSELPVQHIYNFYKKPLTYAIDMGGWVMNAADGLRGMTAQWAQQVLEKNPPHNLTRIKSDNEVLARMLPECTKVIYAIGYERNELPLLNNQTPIADYNETTGYIAPRLFGIGIAFPERETDVAGVSSHCVGFGCFLEYAQNMVPQWVNDSIVKTAKWQRARAQCIKLQKMAELFDVYLL